MFVDHPVHQNLTMNKALITRALGSTHHYQDGRTLHHPIQPLQQPTSPPASNHKPPSPQSPPDSYESPWHGPWQTPSSNVSYPAKAHRRPDPGLYRASLYMYPACTSACVPSPRSTLTHLSHLPHIGTLTNKKADLDEQPPPSPSASWAQTPPDSPRPPRWPPQTGSSPPCGG